MPANSATTNKTAEVIAQRIVALIDTSPLTATEAVFMLHDLYTRYVQSPLFEAEQECMMRKAE